MQLRDITDASAARMKKPEESRIIVGYKISTAIHKMNFYNKGSHKDTAYRQKRI